MVSKYFEIKTNTEKFKKDTDELLNSLAGKKVLLYGAGAGFLALDKTYHFKDRLNIVAISDKKFGSEDINEFYGIKAVSPIDIIKQDFDVILVTNEKAELMTNYLTKELNVDESCIKTIFIEEIKSEAGNLNYLYKQNFDKTLPKLLKKLKNKKVVLYGAGVVLELIQKYFDISSLNGIGIADKKYSGGEREEYFLGYKTISPEEIPELKPDYVIVSTLFYIKIIEDLHKNLLKNTKIKIRPLIDKTFLTLLKEIQEMS